MIAFFVYEVGWTIDQVLECSSEELNLLIPAIVDMKTSDLEFSAKIHGAKFKKALPHGRNSKETLLAQLKKAKKQGNAIEGI